MTTVIVTGTKLSSDAYHWATGNAEERAAAKLDLWTNRFQYANGIMAVGMLRRGGPVGRLPRYQRPKPSYKVNDAHIAGWQGNSLQKTPLPPDAESVFAKTVPVDPVRPTTWFGKNSDGQIYRYSSGNDGTAHYSGTQAVGAGIRNLTKYAQDRQNGE